MSFPFGPITTRDVLRTIEEPQKGWWVAALQLNLVALGFNLAIDGVFGVQTRVAVQLVQEAHVIPAEGQVGPQTSKAIALTLMWPAQGKYRTPPGLGRGIIEGESGYDLACVSQLYSNGTRDVGAWQRNLGDWNSATNLAAAFDARVMAFDTLGKVRAQHDKYIKWGSFDRVAWMLATLYHNRPADADRLAVASVGRTAIDWSVIPDTPGWFTIGGVSYSNREWDARYIAAKTKYVTWN